MRILVLGGTRFIGQFAVEQLASAGHEVIVFHSGQSETDLPPSVRRLHGNFQEFSKFADALRALSPEVVLDTFAMNEAGGRRVLAFKRIARRAVILSSGDVYLAFGRLLRTEPGPLVTLPLGEESPLRTRRGEAFGDYEKRDVERIAVSDPQLPVTILRLPATYGPRDYHNRLFSYIKRMDDGRPAIILQRNFACWRWSRGYVEDIAAGITRAVTDDRAAGRTYNLGEPDAFTEAEWVREIAKITEWNGYVIEVGQQQLPENMRRYENFSQHMIMDTRRARKELAYTEVVPPKEALRRTIEWERSHPPDIKGTDFDYKAEDDVIKTYAVKNERMPGLRERVTG